MNTKYLYLNFDKIYEEKDFFNVLHVDINLKISEIKESNEVLYSIDSITCKKLNHYDPKLESYRDSIYLLNERLNNYNFNGKKEWKLFYLYKELIQTFEILYDDTSTTNYYRGQANDWPMKAGLLRNDIIDDLKKEFENIYEDMAYKYPDLIEYTCLNKKEYKAEDFKKRENNMAYLQHYGLRTTLIDITENPFIALLFLTSNSQVFNNATLDMYNINPKIHSEQNLFSRVKMISKNKRIIAQKGAFFNFEKLLIFQNEQNVNRDKINKIPLVRLKLNFSYDYKEKLKRELNQTQSAFQKLKITREEKLKNHKSRIKEDLKRIRNLTMKTEHDMDSEKSNDYKEELEYLIKRILKDESVIKIDKEMEDLKKKKLYLDARLKKEEILTSEYLRPEICKELREKLKQYHYVESELFPDVYRHIGYIQSNFLSNQTNNRTINKSNISENLVDLLKLKEN
ncbi:FRG domain-containing protein [Staphylococcus aureus]|uniref:FRG domain-containing protein n=1 Tax=Staphylococcus aureus TaxID=1280 RepID=UPI000DA7C093|nr:FRG domain-containing protein [Staphylococcus aureus]PZH35313.1 FRG domain-containing protein [Staphylococcus aureus]